MRSITWLCWSRCGLCLLAVLVGCRDQANNQDSAEPSGYAAEDEPDLKPGFDIDLSSLPQNLPTLDAFHSGIRLQEVQAPLGLEHTYVNGEDGRAMIVETIGGGCGWLDFDNDGWPDLVINQGGDPLAIDRGDQPLDQLFRNIDGSQFRAVTAAARIVEPGYSQGIAVADYDNDGLDDIYVTNYGPNTLWHNCGDGTFQEVAFQAAVSDPRWGTSAAWGDLDRDGDLDLYVCNYCVYDTQNPQECKDPAGFDVICNPHLLDAWPDACFMNLGDGTFRDESQERGLFGTGNRALGVAIADFDNDQWPDVYVANDTTENFLFMNQQNGKFVDEAALRGCAADREGATQGSMGLAVADYDQNGFLDIYCTHYYEESNTLYANFGDQGFRDLTALEGLHQPTLSFLGFGAIFCDLDGNTQPELLIANGHVDNGLRAAKPHMRPQLFALAHGRQWVSIGEQTGSYFQRKLVGRGVATADFDLDGDLDVAIVHENDASVLLRNDSVMVDEGLGESDNSANPMDEAVTGSVDDASNASHAEIEPQRANWLKVVLHGRRSNRRGIGCRVSVSQNQQSWMQELAGGTSFAVSHEPVLVFGLGKSEEDVQISIVWPSGAQQTLKAAVNQTLDVYEPNSD